MRKLAILGLALVPLMSASAQKQGTELTVGVAALGYNHISSTPSTSTTFFDIGNVASIGVAFYMSAGMAIEPMVNLDYQHFDGGSSTSLGIGVGIPFYMNKDWGHTGLFVEPRVGLNYDKESVDNCTACDAVTRINIGGSVGYKMKVSDHVSTRLEGVVTDFLKKTGTNAAPSALQIAGVFSVSIFFGGK